MTYKTFETERLLLRPTSVKDAAFILELLNTPKWLKYIGDRHLKTEADAESYIRVKVLPQLERLGFSNYTLIRKQDRKKIGTCGLYAREGVDGIDIGFAFLPTYEKMGYGFEAAHCIKDAAFTHFGIETLRGFTTKDNVSSQNLLIKLGLKQIGTTFLPNDDTELLLFEITRQKRLDDI